MKVKTLLGLVVLIFLCVWVFPQDVQEESVVINVEVPVRVFQGNHFVGDLQLKDFEMLENGVPQKIEAVYLVKKRSIERSEEKRRFHPETSRTFFLFFEITEYSPRLREAVDYFIKNVIYPGDDLIVVTPLKTYRMKSETFEVLTKKEIIDQLNKLLRRDALIGSAQYRNAVSELAGLAKSLSGAISGSEESGSISSLDLLDTDHNEYRGLHLGTQLIMYGQLLEKLEDLREIDQKKLMNFAEYIKNKEGRKYVFLFYQREFIPMVHPRILNQYMEKFQDKPNIQLTVSDLFDFYKRDISFDVDKVKKVYADSSVSMHFMFITRPRKNISGVRMVEHSEDVYAAFREMAQATGGFMDSSARPDHLFQQALDAAKNYYLVYYTPKNYERNGKFRKIEVKVKNRNYRVIHRAGYFAN